MQRHVKRTSNNSQEIQNKLLIRKYKQIVNNKDLKLNIPSKEPKDILKNFHFKK